MIKSIDHGFGKRFYIKDISKKCPSFLKVTSKNPIALRKGMVISVGRGRTFMEITETTEMPETKDVDNLVQVITEKEQ
jgi:hypothetical protein